MKAIAPALAVFAALFAFGSPAAAATTEYAAQADLNGDGQLDRVVVKPTADNPAEQFLVATVGRRNYVARVPVDQPFGVQPLRVSDIDVDGRDEIIVTEVVGANTLWFSVWVLDGGLHQVRLTDGTPLRLYEGGGRSAVVGYGCEFTGGRYQLFTVGAELVDEENGIYAGERVNYDVVNGVATETRRKQIAGTRDSRDFQANHLMCA
jgi:hypothetical protein